MSACISAEKDIADAAECIAKKPRDLCVCLWVSASVVKQQKAN